MLQYIWMPPVHTQHKESMLCQTKGVSICPYIQMSPVCLDATMFGYTPCMFECPHMFG